jgi:hypothetical protein
VAGVRPPPHGQAQPLPHHLPPFPSIFSFYSHISFSFFILISFSGGWPVKSAHRFKKLDYFVVPRPMGVSGQGAAG